MMRSMLSVFVGFVLWTVIWLGGNQGMQMAVPDSFAEDGSTSQPTVLLGHPRAKLREAGRAIEQLPMRLGS